MSARRHSARIGRMGHLTDSAGCLRTHHTDGAHGRFRPVLLSRSQRKPARTHNPRSTQRTGPVDTYQKHVGMGRATVCADEQTRARTSQPMTLDASGSTRRLPAWRLVMHHTPADRGLGEGTGANGEGGMTSSATRLTLEQEIEHPERADGKKHRTLPLWSLAPASSDLLCSDFQYAWLLHEYRVCLPASTILQAGMCHRYCLRAPEVSELPSHAPP